MPLTQEALDQFMGGEHTYRNPFYGPIQYTDGARYLAEQGEAWWFLDIVATTANFEPCKAEYMQVWTLLVENWKARITCTDGDDRLLYQHPIILTDFPLPSATLWVIDQTVMLPSEY